MKSHQCRALFESWRKDYECLNTVSTQHHVENGLKLNCQTSYVKLDFLMLPVMEIVGRRTQAVSNERTQYQPQAVKMIPADATRSLAAASVDASGRSSNST